MKRGATSERGGCIDGEAHKRDGASAAGDLAVTCRLRGYDAVHLAALIMTGRPEEVTAACGDEELAVAAGLGYGVIPEPAA